MNDELEEIQQQDAERQKKADQEDPRGRPVRRQVIDKEERAVRRFLSPPQQ
jgi:hypothetical protein